jgi:hypothetical protein
MREVPIPDLRNYVKVSNYSFSFFVYSADGKMFLGISLSEKAAVFPKGRQPLTN